MFLQTPTKPKLNNYCYSNSVLAINGTKETPAVPGQFDDAPEVGKVVEKGQGDAPLVAAVPIKN